jgi:toxin ParE1/3/4
VPRVRILRRAAEEAEAAAAWYEKKRQGLGTEFAAAIQTALDLIEGEFIPLAPMPGVSGTEGAKRLILRRFPYDIVAMERNEEIVIIAFAHHSRRPGYWQNRSSP